MAAKKKPVQTLDAKGVGLDAAMLAPKTQLVRLELPPARPPVKLIEGDTEARVKELLRLLHEEAKVI
jgi:electron transfer flavoprotein beta subunit